MALRLVSILTAAIAFPLVADANRTIAQEPATANRSADSLDALKKSLSVHISFDKGLAADFSRGEKSAYARQGKELVKTDTIPELVAVADGKFGPALHFTKKTGARPAYKNEGVLGYNAKDWSATVAVWLRLDPDKDLEPGYCDPVQIIGDDLKKGFVFLEWSKDETPRKFRYAIRPLFPIWNPDNVGWEMIPAAKRPMIQIDRPIFSRAAWTHVAFTLDHINSKAPAPSGRLYVNGQPQGQITNWDLTFAWDPAHVLLVLGASYIGHMDDLAVFNRDLSDAEVKQVYELKRGVGELHEAAVK